MPEGPDEVTVSTTVDELTQRVRAAATGLKPLLAQAETVQVSRAKASGAPRWTDVFTTQFTEFSNRPR
jgi:hypothetical protein